MFSVAMIRCKELVRRFPISVLLVLGVAALAFIAIYNDNFAFVPIGWWAFFSIGSILSVALLLFLEEYFSKFKSGLITLLFVALWGIYSLFLPEAISDLSIAKKIELLVIGGVSFLSMFFVSFLKKDSDKTFYNFAIKILIQLILAIFFGLVIFLGLNVALEAIESLFNVQVSSYLYGFSAVFSFILFSSIYFLSNIPYGEKKKENVISYSRAQKIFTLYILLPLLTLYASLLYIYLFKIIFSWQLPDGMVSILVSALAIGGLILIFLLYPIRLQENSKISNLISSQFSYLVLPLLILMTIGIFRRIGDYGITINRCYILLLNLWFYGVYIYLSFSHSRHFKWVVVSFSLVALLTSVSSFGMAKYTENSIRREIGSTINEKVTFENAKEIFSKMEEKDEIRLESSIRYLFVNFGRKSLQPFFLETLPDDYMDLSTKIGLNINTYTKFFTYDNFDDISKIKGYDYHKIVNDTSNLSVNGNTLKGKVTEMARNYLQTQERGAWRYEDDKLMLVVNRFSGSYSPMDSSFSNIQFEGSFFYK